LHFAKKVVTLDFKVLLMVMKSRPEDPRQTLQDIRNLMERSSRFISLSGLSGISAGIFALLAAAMVYWYCGLTPFVHKYIYYKAAIDHPKWGMNFYSFILLVGAITFIGACFSAWFFTSRKAKQDGQAIWDKPTRMTLTNLAIPLVTGGIFCLGLMQFGEIGYVAPATLVFYGLALVNASHFTLRDVRWLGLSEIALGLIAMFNVGFGLEFWALGFGLLHIIYGTMMYYKYERS